MFCATVLPARMETMKEVEKDKKERKTGNYLVSDTKSLPLKYLAQKLNLLLNVSTQWRVNEGKIHFKKFSMMRRLVLFFGHG